MKLFKKPKHIKNLYRERLLLRKWAERNKYKPNAESNIYHCKYKIHNSTY